MPVLFRSGGGAGSARPPAPIGSSLRSSTGSRDLLNVQADGRKGSSASRGVDPARAVRQLKQRIAEIPKPPADLKQRLKSFYKKHHLKYLNPLVFIMIYMFFGALFFLWLEGSSDERRKLDDYNHFTKEKELFTRRIEEIMADKAIKTRSGKRKSINEAMEYFHKQVGFSVTNQTHWDLATAMYYAGTLFTTIGYGDVSCATTAGRILTVIYSCIGIPLMLITLNDLGKFLYTSINGCVMSIDDAWTYLGVFRICNRKKNNVDIKVDEVEAVERGENQSITSIHSELGSTNSDRENDLDELLEEEEAKTPRMSVKVALGITVGWIFFCSALFRLWEDWTYGESCYFMFISLSTIGLGDISVAHRGMMVLCFVFVIVGLSLVSMCINVVQVAIEEMYMAFLMKLIMEYQEKMAAGGDPKGASMGMMRMWGNNKTAKLLMPLLGKEMKRTAMEKVEVEAQKKGIEIPSILKDVDLETGMPKILQIAEQTHSKKDVPDEEFQMPPELEAMVERHIAAAVLERQASEKLSLRSQSLLDVAVEPPKPLHMTPSIASMLLGHDADTQTDILQTFDESEQTLQTILDDSSTQTETTETKHVFIEREMQTDQLIGIVVETQTTIRQYCESSTSTPVIHTVENDSQTSTSQMREQEIQTYIHEYADAETSTAVETKNIRIQTPHPQIMDKTIQSEDLSEGKSHSPSKMSSARKRIRRALRITSAARGGGRRNTLDHTPAMSDWVEDEIAEEDEEGEGEEGEEDAGSVESLHWDPVDGLHAEKQLPVQKLKAMFDRKSSLK
ncbi:unnamed protein product, partial [Mesorhabditis belari]|uniref:Potassium channel domain-containing protein n=1 Tax=Mesorhabditis belari TaxID=2138241 RepID=A0AAF3J9T6_9BILA